MAMLITYALAVGVAATLKATWHPFCFTMKPLIFYSCLLAILLQAVFASTFSGDKHASLNSKEAGGLMAKPVVGEPIKKGKPQSKLDKDSIAIKAKVLLAGPLLKEPLGIDYTNDAYSILVSTHSWSLKDRPIIAVDDARVYVTEKAEGLRGLNHSSANLKEDERRCIEFDGSQWFDYPDFSSSDDGRYVSFSHEYQVPTAHRVQTKHSAKWLSQGSELDSEFKRVVFDEEDSSWGWLSRCGQTLFYNNHVTEVTRVYQIVEEAGRDPVAFMKFELTGIPRAINAKCNRVMVENAGRLEIHDIGKDASKLVCQLNNFGYTCALNAEGSEAAFVNFRGNKLRIMKVDSVVGDSGVQPQIAVVNVPESLGLIYELVYSDENKLHALHKGGRVSIFDPPTETLIPIEAPDEGQEITNWAISPSANYIATIQRVGKDEKSGTTIYMTTVKRKPTKADLGDLFGRGTDKTAKQPWAQKEPGI